MLEPYLLKFRTQQPIWASFFFALWTTFKMWVLGLRQALPGSKA